MTSALAEDPNEWPHKVLHPPGTPVLPIMADPEYCLLCCLVMMRLHEMQHLGKEVVSAVFQAAGLIEELDEQTRTALSASTNEVDHVS